MHTLLSKLKSLRAIVVSFVLAKQSQLQHVRRIKISMARNDKGFVLVATIVLGLFLGILLGAALFRTEIQLDESVQRLSSQQAFYAAETGVQEAIYEIRRNPQWRPGFNNQPAVTDKPLTLTQNNPSGPIGFYTIEVEDAPDYSSFQSVWVKSTGKDQDGKITRAILARVIVENPAAFFISTIGDLRIGSGSTYQGDILGKDIFFEVNESLTSPAQKAITVTGNIFYLNSLSGQSNPSVTVSGSAQKFLTLTFAGVDLNRYRSIAQAGGHYENGNFTYSNDIDLQSLSAPNGLVFAEGDIHISGQIKDSMLFVAKGNIYIDNNLVASSSSTTSSNSSSLPQLGLLAKKDVFISASAPDDISIDAFVMADGDAGSQGGIFLAQGSKSSKGTVNFNGSIAVRGQNARTAGDLNVYQTRNYSYNQELKSNRKIPFLPFIANIVRWEEIKPQTLIP